MLQYPTCKHLRNKKTLSKFAYGDNVVYSKPLARLSQHVSVFCCSILVLFFSMARFILITIALFIALLFAIHLVLGGVRRLFGVQPYQSTKHTRAKAKKQARSAATTVLYDNGTQQVLQGEAPTNKPHI